MKGDFTAEFEPLGEAMPPAQKFTFSSKRVRIDWRRLHGVDVERVVRNADIQALNAVVDVLAYG
jgi:zinc finger protein DZIP1